MNDNDRFQRWRHRTHAAERLAVFPDGCRDVLVIRPADGPVRVVLTAFDLQPRIASLPAGTDLEGYRLRPGVQVSARVLASVLDDTEQAADILSEECGGWNALDDAIVALTRPGATVASTSRQTGVCVRTLQRHFSDRNLPPPEYWRLLARARRAAALLSSSAALAAIADACDFSDQAHMSRELTRWFGLTPTQLRRHPSILEKLVQPALGNWTGEQISTR